ncbi:MAG: hypothetical protein FWE23_01310 [Chitinivibrionia bacterium]|nr:hypothetical protein [Chitinivibrionia bacterium]
MTKNVAFIDAIRRELKERGLKEPTLEEWKKLAAFDDSDRDLENKVMTAVSMIYGDEPRVLCLNSMRNRKL